MRRLFLQDETQAHFAQGRIGGCSLDRKDAGEAVILGKGRVVFVGRWIAPHTVGTA